MRKYLFFAFPDFTRCNATFASPADVIPERDMEDLTPSEEHPHPTFERRLATILMADVAGYSRMTAPRTASAATAARRVD